MALNMFKIIHQGSYVWLRFDGLMVSWFSGSKAQWLRYSHKEEPFFGWFNGLLLSGLLERAKTPREPPGGDPHVYTYFSAHRYTVILTYPYTSVMLHIHTLIYVYIYIYMCMSVSISISVSISRSISISISIHISTSFSISISISIYIYIYICIYAPAFRVIDPPPPPQWYPPPPPGNPPPNPAC